MIALNIRFWRYLLLAFVATLPFFALMFLGLIWLIQSEWLWLGLLLMAGTSTISWFLLISVRAERASSSTPADSRWSPTEEYAWRRVCEVAAEAEKVPPVDAHGMQKIADMVIHEVSVSLQGKSEFAWASFTLPELLGAVEDAASRTRKYVSARVPGADSLQAAHLLRLYDLYDRHQSLFRAGFIIYRVIRAIKNPANAIAAEAKSFAQDRAVTTTSVFFRGLAARVATEELGRVAINLYGGRYRLPAPEARQRLIDAASAPAGPVPVRIVLAGQVNAGKSSLANALLGAVKSPVSELPTPGGLREFRIHPDDQLDVTVMDTAGINGTEERTAELLMCCTRADLILWVVQANNPARDTDAVALTAIKQQMDARPHLRAPRVLLVMTHTDRLKPVREWAPPYDLADESNTKAANIREALRYAAHALDLQDAPMIPVALRDGELPYNLDALWAAIASHLNDSQLVALDRELKEGGGFSVSAVVRQAYEGSRYVIGKSWQSVTGYTEKLDS